jgi:hypothetical protein
MWYVKALNFYVGNSGNMDWADGETRRALFIKGKRYDHQSPASPIWFPSVNRENINWMNGQNRTDIIDKLTSREGIYSYEGEKIADDKQRIHTSSLILPQPQPSKSATHSLPRLSTVSAVTGYFAYFDFWLNKLCWGKSRWTWKENNPNLWNIKPLPH